MNARIYVACLAAYVSGHGHGRWIDASSDVDEMAVEIQEVLKSSPCAQDQVYPGPKLRARQPHGRNAEAIARLRARRRGEYTTEEWAFHDVEGLPGIGEYSSLDEIASIMELVEEHGADLVEALLAVEDRDVAEEILADGRISAVDGSREDWAYDRVREEIESHGVPESALDLAMNYFDAEKYLRDFDCSGGSFIEAGGQLYVVS